MAETKIRSIARPSTEAPWIRRQMLRGSPKVATFVLEHVVLGEGSKTLERVDVSRDEAVTIEEDVQRIAGLLEEAASQHSGTWSGHTNRYAIVALDDLEKRIGECSFRRHVPGDDLAVGPTEAATERGLLGMFMRHLEGKERFIQSAAGDTYQRLADENDRLQKRVAEMAALEMKLHELLHALQNDSSARELEIAKAKRSGDRIDRLVARAEKVLLPAIETKLGFGPVNRLMDSLTKEQVDKLCDAGILAPEQLASVMELVVQRVEQKDDGKKEEPKGG